MNDNKDIYFATLPRFSNELGDELQKKVTNYYSHIEANGLLDLWRNLYDQYYLSSYTDGMLAKSGDSGEFTELKINHFRSVLNILHTMITSQRPAFDAIANSTDFQSQAQCVLAESLLDWVTREKDLEKEVIDAVQTAILFGSSYIFYGWDVNKGEVYEVNDDGSTINEGDIFYKHILPLDCIREPNKRTFEDNNWIIIRTTKNKYDLAAEYPDKEDLILDTQTISNTKDNSRLAYDDGNSNEEDIYYYYLLHRKTKAVPNGRIVEFISNECILVDSDLPYSKIPVEQLTADLRIESDQGFSVSVDLLQVQQMRDGLTSSIASNQAAFAVQNVIFPDGFKSDTDTIAQGLRAIYVSDMSQAPQPLQLTNTPPEVFNFVNQLTNEIEALSGINSTARGNPPKQVSSGTALAMLVATAMEFQKALERSYVKLLERVGTGTIDIFKQFASVPRMALISGKSSNYLLREFKNTDIMNVQRVFADIGSPFTRTSSGKMELAEIFMNHGFIQNKDQYLMVLQTGKLDNMLESKTSNLLNIRAENEALTDLEEQIPVAIATDKHSMHIQEHLALLDNPETRKDPELVKRVLIHVNEHKELWKTTDPLLLQLVGEQPIAQPQSTPKVSNVQNPQTLTEQKVDGVNPPNLPNSPQGSPQEVHNMVENMKERMSN